ncbi:M20/M25/M40 family metallo-hydrolase [Symbioplanes lichenis]|uniref:M20/M25/M40 family metallo-hydrolase n=1 Tax=Symbioplanes lichenis TaxID=1629072 RepID=UPI002739CE7D|nr:M20/M25/M40 family metallo-hydrolase [Actinoplanes lichenis]
MGPFLRALTRFAALPSVSADPRHAPDVRAAAHWLAAHMRAAGLHTSVLPTGGHPVVLGRRPGPGPAVLLYGHYDVQPPGTRWHSPPFAPQLRGHRLYARGASDDKGPILCQLAALRACSSRPLDVTCLYEGEEEIGSPHLAGFLARHPLSADILLVSDTMMPSPAQPAIVRSLRGAATLSLRVDGPPTDLHSGRHGGLVPNPANTLCALITSLGERFPSVVPSPDQAARRSALSVHGLRAGYTGPGTSSIIPATALARLGLRVAPGQDTATVAARVAAFLGREPTATVRITSTADPISVPPTTPGLAAAAAACTAVFGVPPVFPRSGGTIPALGILRRTLGLDPVLLGFALPADNAHGPDESLHLPTARRATATIAAFLTRLAAPDARPAPHPRRSAPWREGYGRTLSAF